jgi:hypothetical protein
MYKFCFVLGKCPGTGVSLQQARPVYSVLSVLMDKATDRTLILKGEDFKAPNEWLCCFTKHFVITICGGLGSGSIPWLNKTVSSHS